MSRNYPIWVNWLILTVGTCGGSGYLRFPPGTTASFIGILLYPITFQSMPPLYFVLNYIPCVCGSVWILSQCERILGKKDPRRANLDELVAIPLCLWPAEFILSKFSQPPVNAYIWLTAGFLLFRLFDILKPFGIRKLESLPGGIGIVADDLAAALATTACLTAFGFMV
ncbi:MAG: phosphatidylglycerophosphatase A [Puniceicoccales bacterium]|jgi:phosphatidylglycerophosphatase A|nr:phosphatidylglycerophosphatase A [Puniceicoccales bacterium]